MIAQTVSCCSCDAEFPASAIAAPHIAKCPRCEEPLKGPRKPRFSFIANKLTPVDFIQPAFCASCGCILSMIERAGGGSKHCRFPLCQHKRAVASAMELQQKTHDDLARKEASDLDRVETKLRELGHDPEAHDIAILPAFDRPLEKTHERRKRALAERLTEIAAEMRLHPAQETTTSFSLAETPADMPHVAQACATCRGQCCAHGGENAYLTRQTLTRVLEATPGKTLEDVVRRYLELIPEKGHKGSCIYHTDKGCNLPSEMRSNTCNEFYCSGVRSLSTILRGRENAPVLAAALKGEHVVRLVVINGQDMTTLFEK